MRSIWSRFDRYAGESPMMREQLRRQWPVGGISLGFIAFVVLRILANSSAHHMPQHQYVPDLQLPKELTEDGTMVFIVAGLKEIKDGDTWRFDCRDTVTKRQIAGGNGKLGPDITKLKLKVPMGSYSGTASLDFWHEPRKGHCAGQISIK